MIPLAALALGAAVLLLAVRLARGFATASVAQVKRGLLGAAVVLGLAAAGGLVAIGRGGLLVWLGLVFGPLAWRWWQGRRLAGRFGAAPAGRSTVETATLAMELDLATGAMGGTIRRGPQAGRTLAELDLPELLALLDECRTADPESVPLLETWLDRSWPDWAASAPPPGAADGPMDRAAALAVLGLREGATEAEVREAHRRLLRGVHPDHGGSDWLAARINEARDRLLG